MWSRSLLRPGIRGGEFEANAAYWVIRAYARCFHRLRVEGAANIPPRRSPEPRPVLFVANHTSGADPLLIQAAVPYEVRWVMALDMRGQDGKLDWLWDFGRLIFVDRMKGEAGGLREAIRHLRRHPQPGGPPQALGLFPEGHIERPERQLLPFLPGVGLVIKAAQPIVVPVVIEGTPQVDPAWASLWTRSRARVRFLPALDYRDSTLDAQGIAADLRERFRRETGWPLNEMQPRAVNGAWVYPEGVRVRRRGGM